MHAFVAGAVTVVAALVIVAVVVIVILTVVSMPPRCCVHDAMRANDAPHADDDANSDPSVHSRRRRIHCWWPFQVAMWPREIHAPIAATPLLVALVGAGDTVRVVVAVVLRHDASVVRLVAALLAESRRLSEQHLIQRECLCAPEPRTDRLL